MGNLLILCLACSFVNHQSQWADIIKDAQADNIDKTRHGKATIALEYLPARDEKPIIMEGEVFWNNEAYFQKFRIEDPDARLLGREDAKMPLNSQPWEYSLKLKNSYLITNTRHNLVIERETDNLPTAKMLVFHPDVLWFKCCPPLGAEGRPWPEMVGLVLRSQAKRGRIDFVELSNGLVRQIRTDPDGGKQEITFSIADGGNPVNMVYYPADRRFGKEIGTWKWIKIGEAYVLDSLEYTISVPGNENIVDMSYKLKSSNINLNRQPSNLFSRNNFFGLIPDGSVIQDRKEGRSYRLLRDDVIDDDTLNELSEKIKSDLKDN